MPKHTRSSRNCFDLTIFTQKVVQDLEQYLPQDILVKRDVLSIYRSCESWLARADMHSESPVRYAAVRQIHALLHKNADLPLSSDKDRRENAFDAFTSSEMKCRTTNKRLSHYRRYPSRQPQIWNVINMSQSIIKDCLGTLTPKVFNRILRGASFGPGATYGSSHPEHRHLYYKLDGPHTVTSSALPYFKVALNRYYPHWREVLMTKEYNLVNGNRVAYVPKTWKTHRTIAVEPSLNTFLSKGVEKVLTGCLRRRGINLREQKPNQDMARQGSVDGSIATVDLSAASDTISYELVRLMLPSDWFILLDDLRSSHYTLDKGKTWHEYAKFSSMGNACTFPIETLIFWAVAKACVRLCGSDTGKLRVYGDDVIIPVECFGILSETYRHLGFSLNMDKSFAFGPFRESCGGDFLLGIDVRPVYLKSNPRRDDEVYNLYNRLYSNRFGFRLDCTLCYLHSCAHVKAYGPEYANAAKEDPDWYAGKNRVFDSFFFAPPRMAARVTWDENTQSYVYRSKGIVRRSIRAPQSRFNDNVRYLCFLLGLTEGMVHYVSKTRVNTALLRHRWWPEMQWEPSHYW